jgi:enoyl-[acyl-carrier-protein] reductase (NADH)
MGFLQEKRVLITGVSSNRSIAYGVAKAMHREGACIALSYQGQKLKSRVEDLAGTFQSELVLPLDVSKARISTPSPARVSPLPTTSALTASPPLPRRGAA